MSVDSQTMMEKLEILGCPLTEGIRDASVVKRMLTSPGDQRIRILSWLVAKLSQTEENFNQSRRINSCEIALTNCLPALLVCPADLEFIRGRRRRGQERFLHNLLDITISQSVPLSANSADRTAVYQRHVALIDRTCADPFFEDIFSDRVDVFRADLLQRIDDNWRTQRGHLSSMLPPQPQLDQLIENEATCQQDLHGKTCVLEESRRQIDHVLARLAVDDSGRSSRRSVSLNESSCQVERLPRLDIDVSVLKRLELTVSSFRQLCRSFIITYDQELSGWCSAKSATPRQADDKFQITALSSGSGLAERFSRLMKCRVEVCYELAGCRESAGQLSEHAGLESVLMGRLLAEVGESQPASLTDIFEKVFASQVV